MSEFPIDYARQQFPAMQRELDGRQVAYFDGPAGSQVPQSVAAAMTGYLLNHNANHGGPFATSIESDAVLDQAHRAAADFLGASDPDCVAFGANMTSLTFALSRALAQTWTAGDEIIVTRLDHDANVSPWALAARDAGVTVRHIDVHPEDCTLNMADFTALLSPRTRLVAVGYASNATGTINPLPTLIEQAHQVGARVFIDAVHYAPHRLIDVEALDCDFLCASAYKFFGPHVGMLYGKRDLLETLQPYKLHPAPDELPGRWMTGTQNHEGIAGVAAAIEYLADLGRQIQPAAGDRRAALHAVFEGIQLHEDALARQLLTGLEDLPDVRIWGITDPERLEHRVPTFSLTHTRLTPREIATRLGEQGLFAWSGNHYALPLTERLGLEPDGTLRIGLLHYNTAAEVDRLLAALREILSA